MPTIYTHTNTHKRKSFLPPISLPLCYTRYHIITLYILWLPPLPISFTVSPFWNAFCKVILVSTYIWMYGHACAWCKVYFFLILLWLGITAVHFVCIRVSACCACVLFLHCTQQLSIFFFAASPWLSRCSSLHSPDGRLRPFPRTSCTAGVDSLCISFGDAYWLPLPCSLSTTLSLLPTKAPSFSFYFLPFSTFPTRFFFGFSVLPADRLFSSSFLFLQELN